MPKQKFMVYIESELIFDMKEEILKNQKDHSRQSKAKNMSQFVQEALIWHLIINCNRGILYKLKWQKKNLI